MAAGILNHYFPASNGFAVIPVSQRNRYNNSNDNSLPGFGLTVLRHHPGHCRGFIDHINIIITKAKVNHVNGTDDDDDLRASLLKGLENSIEHANMESGRCWAILVHGGTFTFCRYYHDLPENQRLVWGEPRHARFDDARIDGDLRYMREHETPPAW